MDAVVVTCYTNPDLDGFACAIAYAEFLNKFGTAAGFKTFGQPNIEARYLMKQFGFDYPKQADITVSSRIVLVDSSELRDLDKIVKPENVVEVIDHRKVNDAALFVNAKIQIEVVGAAATLIAEKFHAHCMDISVSSATLLYGAIVSNTLNFRANVTTERDVSMARWLESKLNLPENFIHEMFRAKSDMSGEKLSERIDGDLASFHLGGKKISIAQLEIIGVRELVRERESEILSILRNFKLQTGLHGIFLSAIDLEEKFNAFVTDEEETKRLLEKTLGVSFEGNVAIRDGFIMRKEIVPLLKAEFEGKTPSW